MPLSSSVVNDGRAQMIAAAERIVAEEGLAAMSLRSVQRAAGQRNKSAAQYHFGSREGLVEAVLTARMGPINERRLQRLLALDGQGTIRELAEIVVEPLAEVVLGDPDSRWARFALQTWADPSVAVAVQTSMEGEALRILIDRLTARLDDLPVDLRIRRVQQALGLVFLGLAAVEAERAQGRPPGLAESAVAADLVDVFVAAVAAPSTTQPDPARVANATTAPEGDP